ncbi:MAG: hypothetical protein JO090_12635, partial [Rhizobacter sp.]|nr:hypothetical protein [Rhizobacter sp.]
MHCTDGSRSRRQCGFAAAACIAFALIACSAANDRGPGETSAARTAQPKASATTSAGATEPGRHALPAPRQARNWAELRQQAAERIVAANPEITYTGAVPDPLLAIPVLEIELHADGSIRRI